VVLGRAPKFYKGCHKFTLIALSADVGQADDQIVLKKALNNNISVDSGEIEVYSKHIEHVQALLFHKILQDSAQLSLGNILDTTVLDKFL
jgi:hypothetical protein